MPKETIRKKIDEIKQKSEIILSSKEISNEVRLFISSLLILIDVIVVSLLTKKVRKNSSNSGLPPSQNFGSNGNRNKYINNEHSAKGNQLSNTRKITEQKTIRVNKCQICNADLSSIDCKDIETRKEIDIIYEIVTTEVAVEIKECDHCGKINKGHFPKGMNGEIQYGTGIKSAIINYLFVQMMSLEKIQEHFKGFIGRFISQATMLKYIFQFYMFLEIWEKQQLKKILLSPVIHVDETSIRINKINYWLHVYTYGEISLQFVHVKRGIEAVNDINIIPRYGGIIVHDCWATYFYYNNVDHALCGAHILRELKYIEEMECHIWVIMMKELLQEAAEVIADRPDTAILTLQEYKKLETRYREILHEAKFELAPFPEEKDGHKGRVKHTEAQNLWLRLKKYEKSILMFARIKKVDFTNNRAERDIRCSKTKQKISGGFRTLKYANAYARITSYIKSMRYKGYSSLQAINLAITKNISL